jgi:PAS domain S-box-containing protein
MNQKPTHEEPEQRIQNFGTAESRHEISEAALIKNEGLYRTIVEEIPTLICVFLPDGEISFVNSAFCEYFGKSPDDLVGTNLLSLVFETDRETVKANIAALTRESPAHQCEHRVVSIDGESRWQQCTSRALFDNHGEPVAYVAIAEDITERKKTEAALRINEERLRLASQAADFGTYDTDLVAGTRYWSSNMRRIIGLSDDAPVTPIGKVPEFIHPDDVDKMQQSIKKAFDPAGCGIIDEAHRIIRPDGSVCWVSVKGKVLFAGEGDQRRPVRACGMLRDITEHKHAEAELRRLNEELERIVSERTRKLADSEAKHRCLVENILDISFQVDNSGRLQYISPQARPYGFDPAVVVGQSFLETIFPADRERMANNFNRTHANGEVFPSEFRIQTPDGRICWFEEKGNVLRDDTGAIVGITGVLRDITERKAAEDALRESEERYRTLFEIDSDAIMLYDAETRKFMDVNPAALKLYGYTRDEFLNLTHWDITNEPDASEAFIRRAERGEGIDPIPLRWHRKKDGTVFPVEISPSRFTFHGRTVLCSVMRDITTRMAAEAALRQSEEKFRELTEQSPNMIFIIHNERVVYANNACVTAIGYTREEFSAPEFDFRTLYTPGSAELVQSRLVRQNMGEELSPCELTLVTKDHQHIDAILSTRLINYAESMAMLCVLTDISERKKAERVRIAHQKRLRQLSARLASAQDEEQRRLAEGLHDDIAQILAACLVKLGVMERARDLTEIKAATNEIDGLLRTVIEKIRSLSFELSSSTLYKLGFREALVELCEIIYMRYGIQVKIESDGHDTKLDTATATVLFKAARELLFNVVKHANVRQSTLRIYAEENMLMIAVEDRGRGFPNGFKDESVDMGKGLGLLMIRERLKDIEGDLHIESVPGVCTRVILCVPLGESSMTVNL